MVAEVIINSTAKKLNRTFDYNIPKELEKLVFVGTKVLVPFGRFKNLEEAHIVKIKEDSQLSTSLTSIAFRCPGDLWLRKVIAECGRPIYSTSVNRSGFPVLQDFEEIKKEFEAEVDMIVSGTCTGGQPSTIVSLQSDGTIKILRQGSLVL